MFLTKSHLILMVALIEHMPECEERRHVGEHSVPPGGVRLVGDDHVLLVAADRVVQRLVVVVFVWEREVVLGRRQNAKLCDMCDMTFYH